ncbi:MAG: 50S ribosomal protein L3 N(5)-glutamine methyltransferase [Candidatus Dactylopiibacterium carminicum]|uniref:Ribosomal protein uL3 glutamine methyltransferase n=1 Tax=Candidatus Dactylopiibacterium carminicum TaxID=857335 RepID=A0A272EXP1_9RHOO|nr:50S ribosomal protein L3 N(5)-glutamine methyltransferase [Candidatus Dactylopiibacterium carminicum]KAF7600548.1 50S ribosomal protein L3 N(5)-glutamine methyltransferase [Candidatus Dactylopiibacterium carminicum]PAS94883.1 MAG: 50S ribosomal protein L3 N(5)-glutamine methyltransferase [Candidatus Dactylopiibacterium carminicum]PAT00552.1 MAG: ribosomal protein L3 N(5)-glutamine methyltransferase [Candidatus Dactylopiibacterium carminicum]
MTSHPHHEHDEDCDCGHDHEHDHHHDPIDELVTVRDLIRYATSQFNRAGLFFGHGSSEAYDEAVYLVLHTLHLPLDWLDPFLDACIPSDERAEVLAVLRRRTEERLPAAYLTQEAWLGDFRFYVDERVIVPRSFCFELLEAGFEPWIEDPLQVSRALDLCTGSGCLAILLAHHYPNAQVDAIDLSPDALEVARRNVADYGLEEVVRLIESDVFEALGDEQYDLILSNPPYVTPEVMEALPEEYRHEPEMALAGGGEDGLTIVRRIIEGARRHLTDDGILVVEVGHNRELVEAAWPDIEFVWLSNTSEESRVFLLRADQLPG